MADETKPIDEETETVTEVTELFGAELNQYSVEDLFEALTNKIITSVADGPEKAMALHHIRKGFANCPLHGAHA